MRKLPRRLRRAIIVAAWTVGAGTAGQAGTIVWERAGGAFQTCLEGRRDTWVNAKAELVANEDPAAGDIDDLDVALWTVQAMQSCAAQVGKGDPVSEQHFSKHMAHWREHIYAVAQAIRKRGHTD